MTFSTCNDDDTLDPYKDLCELVEHYGKDNGIPLRISRRGNRGMIRISWPTATSLVRAQDGLEDVTEMASTVVEHHPYWGLLYHSSEIASTTLERWNGTLTDEEISEIGWALREMKSVIERLAKTSIDVSCIDDPPL